MDLGRTACTLAPLAGAALLVFCIVRQARRADGRGLAARLGTGAWVGVFALLEVVVLALVASSIYRSGAGSVAAFSAVCAAAGVAASQRDRVFSRVLAAGGRGLPMGALVFAVDLVLVLVASYLAFFSVELPWNDVLADIAPLSAASEQAVIALAMLAAWFVVCRRNWACSVLLVVLQVIGLAQYFVVVLKGSVIMPGDLLALGTAAAVGSNLRFQMGTPALDAMTITCVGLALLAYVMPVRAQLRCVGEAARAEADAVEGGSGGRLATRVPGWIAKALEIACCVALACAYVGVARDTSVRCAERLAEEEVKFWEPASTYREHGFLTSFLTIAHDMPIDAPAGYSEGAAREVERAWGERAEGSGEWANHQAARAQFDEVRPSVVCIMNETFADLRVLGDFGYPGPRFFSSVDDCLSRGHLFVSVLGGSTCNSEFEFLTGNSMAFVGPGKYPYNLYDLSRCAALPQQMRQLGYATHAIHPNLASNWKRDKVYEQFGFDEFLDIEDFEGAPEFHSGVTDAATYDRVLELLEGDRPQFVFDVTMQNHTGYDQFNIPEDKLEHYALEGQSDYDNAQLSEYVSCIEESDRALEAFLGRLRALDRPVIVVFFGDHQPNISPWENDRLSPEADHASLDHIMKTYQTNYLVWANYDVAGSDQVSEERDLSLNYLGTLMGLEAGLPLTDYQRAQAGLMQALPVVTPIASREQGGPWYKTDEAAAPFAGTVRDLSYLNYLEFGSRV